jgi:alkyldihydroxyacetonephosphate synthase
MSSSLKTTTPHVIIAPTHRSFYDFLIVSYICFALPELGYDLPHIAASSDFESIPVIGWLARRSHAFFLNRGGIKNENLNDDLSKLVKNEQRPAFIEVFIEGKRSRTRTFVKPKTGFLRCLSRIKHDYIIIPLTINYEGIPDEESLVTEANSGCAKKMSLTKLTNWLYRIYSGTVNIGRVYVSASGPLRMHHSIGSDVNELAYAIQSHQQSQMLVSNYHVRATSLALGMSEEAVLEAMSELGCNFWPESDDMQMYLQPPDNCDLQWTAMLQLSHLLGPYLSTSHRLWSSWTCPASDRSDAKVATCKALIELLTKLTESFDLAQNEVDLVFNYLQSKGFDTPEEKHVVQYLPVELQLPLFLMQVVVKDKFANASGPSRFVRRQNAEQITPAFQAGDSSDTEAFGAWGYQDSCFVLNVKHDGSKSVTMKGSRYSISGKPISRLASFIEEELNIVIDPTSLTFPIRRDFRSIQESSLCTENVKQLVALLGDDENRVSLRVVDRARHGTGHSQEDMFALRTESAGFRVPDAVVWPKRNKEVQSLVTLAAHNSWCLIPFGGGTNVTHATHCPSRDIDPRPMISVDMKLMCRILWVNEEDGLVHVEAGITGSALIESIEKRGFTIGHEPDSYEFSTLGGWIATKASGMKQNRYGNIEDIVREVSVVGANGIMSHSHKVEMSSVGRSSTGVDLKSLMIGSEGCLGIIVSAVIKIWPIAESRSHESVLLPNFTIGMRFMKDVSKLRAMKPASVRLLDNDQFRLGQALKVDTTKYASLAQRIAYQLGNLSEKSVVCATIAFEGTSEEVKLQEKCIRQLASTYGGILAGSNVGKAGYALTFAIAYLRDFALNYNILGESFETFVPWSKLSQVCCKTKQRIYMEHRSRALPGAPFVCCRITQLYDDGACVYFYFCMDISGVANPSSIFAEIEHSARQEILIQGGTLSHHHGLGKRTGTLTRQIHSSGYVQALISVKAAIDPKNTFGARNGVFSMTDLSEGLCQL